MEELALGRPGLNTQPVANLIMGVAFDIVQHEHGSVPRRQRGDGRLEINREVQVTGERRDVFVRCFIGLPFPPALASAVEHDRGQPRAER